MADKVVVDFGGVTKLDLQADRVLAKALEAGLASVVIVGYDNEGAEFFASSYADGARVVWHLERAKFKLMVIADEMANDPQRSK